MIDRCALCGQKEGHSERCSVTRHKVDPMQFRMGDTCCYCKAETSVDNPRCIIDHAKH
jgi:hypothetical protein